MKITIELLGLCGAGKSTFVNAINKKFLKSKTEISLERLPVPSKNEILINLLKIIVKFFFYSPIKMIFFLSKKNHWWLLKKISYRQAANTKKNNKNLIVIDGGVLQPFISFEIEKKITNMQVPLNELLKCITLPNVILLFEVSERIAKERYKRRSLNGNGQLLRENSDYYFKKANIAKDIIKKYCMARKVKLIIVNSNNQFTNEYINIKLREIIKELDFTS